MEGQMEQRHHQEWHQGERVDVVRHEGNTHGTADEQNRSHPQLFS